MHGLSDIVRMNSATPSQTVASPNADDDFADIAYLVHELRINIPEQHGFVRLTHDEASRIADYLVAAYGIQE